MPQQAHNEGANFAAPDPSLKHPADNLYTYTLCVETPAALIRRGYPRLPWRSPRYQLSIRPDPLVRLKTIMTMRGAFTIEYMTNECNLFVETVIPNTPIRQPSNPNIDDRPIDFFLNCRGFLGEATPLPSKDAREMASWTMEILKTVATVMTLVFPHAQNLQFSRKADDEAFDQDSVVDDPLYVPLYYKKKESHTSPVNESLVKLVVAQLTPWSFSDHDILEFTNMTKFPSYDIDSECQIHGPHTFNRVQKIWARLYSDCARVNCPYFIITNGEAWLLGIFFSGWTRAGNFQIFQRLTAPSIFQWLIFWCASALKIPGSWSLPPVLPHKNPDVRLPMHLQPAESESDFAGVDDQIWVNDLEHCETSFQTEQESDSVWTTNFQPDDSE